MSHHEGNGLIVGVGYIDGSAPRMVIPDPMVEVMRETFGPPEPDSPSRHYRDAVKWEGGEVRVEWNGRGDALGSVRGEVKQTALDGLGLDGSIDLLGRLHAVGHAPSRLDGYVDDLERRMTPDRVRAAVLAGQAVTHARPGEYRKDDDEGRSTYYIGRPGSDRRTRTYDKPDPDRTRMELQARRDSARGFASDLLRSDVAARPRAVMAGLVAFVDFRESKARDRDGVRRPRLDWWEAIVGDTVRAGAAPSRPGLTISAQAEWVLRYMAPLLARLYREMGPEWLAMVLRAGEERLDRVEEWAA